VNGLHENFEPHSYRCNIDSLIDRLIDRLIQSINQFD
jgi:hypothetical protein